MRPDHQSCPCGATSGLKPKAALAGLLLAGLLSDTLILRSPTTTERDLEAAHVLSGWALGPGGMGYADFEEFGEAALSAGAGFAVRSIESILNSDLKIYEGGEFKFGIAQAEVANLMELDERLPAIRAE